jgi:hypothetical protein
MVIRGYPEGSLSPFLKKALVVVRVMRSCAGWEIGFEVALDDVESGIEARIHINGPENSLVGVGEDGGLFPTSIQEFALPEKEVMLQLKFAGK